MHAGEVATAYWLVPLALLVFAIGWYAGYRYKIERAISEETELVAEAIEQSCRADAEQNRAEMLAQRLYTAECEGQHYKKQSERLKSIVNNRRLQAVRRELSGHGVSDA